MAQEVRKSDKQQAARIKLEPFEFERKKRGGKMRVHTKNHREGSVRHPPLAEIGVDGARSFADHTMGARGTAVRPRGVRWRSGTDGRQRGMLKQA